MKINELDIELIIESLQLLIDYKKHGITKINHISDLLDKLEREQLNKVIGL